MVADGTPRVEVEVLTKEEGVALFDERCQQLLGISGEQFLAEYDDDPTMSRSDDCVRVPCAVCEIVFLLPFVRRLT